MDLYHDLIAGIAPYAKDTLKDAAPNYYQILGLETSQYFTDIQPQELKTAYHQALLLYHPDKASLSSTQAQHDRSKLPSTTVNHVALAYQTLSEPLLKAQYDRWLRFELSKQVLDASTSVPIFTGLETVDLDDLTFDSETTVWSKSCRCGEEKGFLVSVDELERNFAERQLIVGCKGCSLWLMVLYGTEECDAPI